MFTSIEREKHIYYTYIIMMKSTSGEFKLLYYKIMSMPSIHCEWQRNYGIVPYHTIIDVNKCLNIL